MFWTRKCPFLARKAPKRAPNFFLKKRHNFRQRRHNMGIFWLKMTHHTNFYVIIFSKYPKYNISQRFFNIFNWKISFWRFFLILLGAPNYFWRHKEFQKRHSGAKAPLLATLILFTKIMIDRNCTQALFYQTVYQNKTVNFKCFLIWNDFESEFMISKKKHSIIVCSNYVICRFSLLQTSFLLCLNYSLPLLLSYYRFFYRRHHFC